MSYSLITKDTLTAISDSIRKNKGTETEYAPSGWAENIDFVTNPMVRIMFNIFGGENKDTIDFDISDTRNYMFFGATGLKKINTPIKEFAVSSFEGCENLEEVNFSECEEIDGYAFSKTGFITLDLYNTPITLIANSVFESCGRLENLILPAGSTKIQKSLCRGCSNLKTLYIPASTTNGTTISSSGNSPVLNCPNVHIYMEASQNPDGLGAYFPYISSTETATVSYGVSYEDYLEIINNGGESDE